MEKKKILVVDNNPVIIKLMTSFLTEEGHEVVGAKDAFDALDILRKFTPEIIYLDLVMPKIGGDTLCKIFRTIPLLANCYIAIVSAAVIEQDIDLLEIGADAYIAKGPFSMMRVHILATIAESAAPRHVPASPKIRGIENLHSRQITTELLSQNKHLQIILESISQGIVAITDIRVFYANPAALFLLQVDLETLLGAYLDKILDASTWGKLAPLIEARADMVSNENKTVLKIHDRYIIPQCLTMQEDRRNQVVLLMDVTERERADEELKNSLSLLSASLESTADGILIVDRQGKISRWNQKFAEMWKIPHEVLSSGDDEKTTNSILTQLADPVQFRVRVKELYKHPEKSSFDQIEFVDGRVFEHYSQPQRIEDTIVGRVWSFRDITARKQAEYELRESEDKFRLTFNSSPDAVNVNRLNDGLYVDINESFTRATGFTREDVIGKTSLEIDLWGDPADRKRLVQGLRERGIFENLEAQFRKKDGSLVTGLMSARMISLKGVPHIVSITRDITERKKHEQEQLKIEKLESLGILAGGIAHDFNNILTGIMGNISLAKVFLDTAHKSYKPLAEAERAAVRAGELAHQLLTFARGGEPIKKVVSPQYLVNEAVSFVLRGSNVKGTTDVPDYIHAFEVDEGQISQVFHNIIINATQAMPGGGTLTVTARNETLADNNSFSLPPGMYIRLTFADQGCGIAEDTLKRIFDPYFTTKTAGIGLGLASVHSIVSKHGGHIGACSVIGKGTTFTIHLPSIGKIYTEYQAHVAMQASGEQKGGAILVMDDDETIRDIASSILTYLGYEVTTCANGEDAIELYKNSMASGSPFLTVIMDLTIPGGLGGKQAAEQILSMFPKACLIVSSGYSNDPIMSNYQEYGFSAAIAKPYNIDEVEQVLGTLFTSLM
jgi:PAS domain S-box-containing protein